MRLEFAKMDELRNFRFDREMAFDQPGDGRKVRLYCIGSTISRLRSMLTRSYRITTARRRDISVLPADLSPEGI